MRFRNRADAGRQLAGQLEKFANRSDVVVLGLPRGGIPVANEVASRLKAPLDVFLVRKLGVPGHPELAMGAIAEGGVEVLSRDLIRDLGIPHALVEQVAVRERLELERRDTLYRGDAPPSDVRDRTVILVDDGLATGSTMEAAVLALRQQAPGPHRRGGAGRRARNLRTSRARGRRGRLRLTMPEPFNAVGLWYEEFAQTTDEEVAAAARSRSAAESVRSRPRYRPESDAVESSASARCRSPATRRSTTRCSTASATRASCCSARRRTARTSSTASARTSRGG